MAASTERRGYRIGFSPAGLVASLLPLAPNVLWAVLPPVTSSLGPNDAGPWFVEMAGAASQVSMIALLVMVVPTRSSTARHRVVGATSIVCLAAYLASWGWYFTQSVTPALLVAMAALPAVYFIGVCLCLRNRPALVPAIAFAVIHVSTTGASYL